MATGLDFVSLLCTRIALFFFFNDTATTEIYTLSLHDALPISLAVAALLAVAPARAQDYAGVLAAADRTDARSEEHTSELQSRENLVCRLLLEKKKKNKRKHNTTTKTNHKSNTTPLYIAP